MWFDDPRQIVKLAAKNSAIVCVMPNDIAVRIPGVIVVQPETKSVITIEQIRKMIASLELRQTKDRFILIRPADKLSLEAANAFLKSLEEPGEKIHYVLMTETPSRLLPTILSRAAIYWWRDGGFSMDITADEDKKTIAKRLIAAKPKELIEITEMIAKKKTARAYALEILGLTIEMLTKSYFITEKEGFIKKLPKFLATYENISKNGHIKLQMIANLT